MPSLERYIAKRNFQKTPEPKGGAGRKRAKNPVTARPFVIQKHAARRLHYDLRLEWQGVLICWAVPKGPPESPDDKRLAVRTEDHPLEYLEFQGVIPQGQYGAGVMEIWDRGTWTTTDKDIGRALEKGVLHVTLNGARAQGHFVLARMDGKDEKENWLWMKKADSDGIRPPPWPDARAIDKAKAAPMPARLSPQLASAEEAAPRNLDRWIYEIKFDGYRALARVEQGRARIITRNGKDWTERFRAIADALDAMDLPDCILDGEIVALDERGVSDFGELAAALTAARPPPLHYYLFDILYWDGLDLRAARQIDRKDFLRNILAARPRPRLHYSDHMEGDPQDILDRACALHLEGMIAKDKAAPYANGRSRHWRKMKCLHEDEFIVIGFTPPQGARSGFGALHVAAFNAGRLRYAGGVGTGFDQKTLARIHGQLEELRRPQPLDLWIEGEGPPKAMTWVEPRLVAQVRYTEITADHHLRHPVFLGLRDDKDPNDVLWPASRAPRAAVAPKPAQTRITNPNKILWPEKGYAKSDLAEYWRRAADRALPYLMKRPLALLRCPDGEHKDCFFQKNPSAGMPPGILQSDTGQETVLWIKDAAGLVDLAQMGVMEIHPWGSSLEDVERPNVLIFDLDPGEGVAFEAVITAALELRERLERLGLRSFCKLTGGKGLHVLAPLTGALTWDGLKSFTKAMAQAMEKDDPKRFISVMSKSKRRGKIFVDYLRNGRGATAIAPYSPRARGPASLALPLAWDEVAPGLAPQQYDLMTDLNARPADPWPDYFHLRQSITLAMRRKLGLKE